MVFDAGKWPCEKGDEIDNKLFEDIRKWFWCLQYRYAGTWIEPVNITRADWVSWATGKGEQQCGDLHIKFENEIYVNNQYMTEQNLIDNPPTDSEGNLNSYWYLGVNYNKYSHWGELSDRWICRYDVAWPGGGYDSYDFTQLANKFLPPVINTHDKLDKTQITGDLRTHYVNDWGDWQLMGLYPPRVSEYAITQGEPLNSQSPSGPGQHNYEIKMGDAYQEWAIYIFEVYTRDFVKEVDSDWISAWETGIPGYGGVTYNPDENADHPIYVKLYDELWNCNGSAYELLLRELGDEHYDWWWDPDYPHIPK